MKDHMPRGRPEDVSDEEILRAVRGLRRPFGAVDASDEIKELGPERARERLNHLVNQGVIEKTYIGGSNVYWIESPTQSHPEGAH